MTQESKWTAEREVMILDFHIYEAKGYPIGQIKYFDGEETGKATCFWESWYPAPKIGSTFKLRFKENGEYLNFFWPPLDHEEMNPNGTRKPTHHVTGEMEEVPLEVYEEYNNIPYPENDLDIPF